MGMIKNKFNYDVYGENLLAGFKDTTWKQKNITHFKYRVRRIFRFGSETPQFKAEKAKWEKLIVRPILDDEETKVSAKKYQINITGSNAQTEATEKAIRRMFAEETNHFSNYEPVKFLADKNFGDL